MALQRYETTFETLNDDMLAAWRDIPSSIVSDVMNRSQVMAARIKPVAPGMRLCGQARTVTCMAGDNAGPHRLIAMCRPGEVIVIDARGVENVAVWGAMMTEAAVQKGVAGIVVEGAVRDVAELRERNFATFSSAIVPAGPHKNFGGILDGPVAVGDCPVMPGDLIVGDDDGVSVVPLAWVPKMLELSRKKIADEQDMINKMRAGVSSADYLGVPEAEVIS